MGVINLCLVGASNKIKLGFLFIIWGRYWILLGIWGGRELLGVGREVRVLKIYNGNFYCFFEILIINENNSNSVKLIIVNNLKFIIIDLIFYIITCNSCCLFNLRSPLGQIISQQLHYHS